MSSIWAGWPSRPRPALEAGDPEEAARLATEYLREDPFDESMAAFLMERLRAARKYSRAAQVYQRLKEQLSEELGVDPLESTTMLYYEIMNQWNDTTQAPGEAGGAPGPRGTGDPLCRPAGGGGLLRRGGGAPAAPSCSSGRWAPARASSSATSSAGPICPPCWCCGAGCLQSEEGLPLGPLGPHPAVPAGVHPGGAALPPGSRSRSD